MKITADGDTGRCGPALLPVPAQLGMGYQSWGPVSGSPSGPVSAPAPAAVPQSYNRALHRSSDAPDSWCPGVYYQPTPPAGPNVATESDNQMPLPAVQPNGVPAYAARRPVFLRQNQVGQPFVTSNYPWRGGNR